MDVKSAKGRSENNGDRRYLCGARKLFENDFMTAAYELPRQFLLLSVEFLNCRFESAIGA